MQTPEHKATTDNEPEQLRVANLLSLEIVFLAIVALFVVVAFFEALTYKLVSSRTPLVVMAPLLLLIAFHARRLYVERDRARFSERLKTGLGGGIASMNKVVSISLWMGVMLALITVLGHYIGIFLFAFVLMWWKEKERLLLSLAVVGITTALLALLFEYGFNVEMYRGLLFRWMAGYRDFG